MGDMGDDGVLPPLLPALDAWRGLRRQNSIARTRSSPSCAHYSVEVGPDIGDDIDGCVRDLAEFLRLVELTTRPHISQHLLPRLISSSDGGCDMGQRWCSFCDGVDRRVVVQLRPLERGIPGLCTGLRTTHATFLAVVRRAVFDWDDSTASPEFHELRSRLLVHARGTARSCPVELTFAVFGGSRLAIRADLEALLERCRGDGELFQVVVQHASYLEPRAMALLAASQTPVEVTFPLNSFCPNHYEDETELEDVDPSELAIAEASALASFNWLEIDAGP
ncbi:hypothetical protein ATCC90586_005998 [Pythium insidiosum]|nr:hypothetical protein ATCC90586_005998 [Pythium insidiosum]